MLEHAASFCSEQCPEGVVAIAGNTLRILTVEKLGNNFTETRIKLNYTPRKFLFHPYSKNILIVMQAEHQTYPEKQKQALMVNFS